MSAGQISIERAACSQAANLFLLGTHRNDRPKERLSVKVILTEDVQGLGSIGDVADVAQGYANNFLIPRKLAILATPGNLKHWDEKREWIVKREAANRTEAEELAAKIEGAKLRIVAKAGEEGRLYGSVTVKDIAAKILEDLKIDVDRKKILLAEPIKTAGEHEATLRVFKDIDAKISIEVVGELEEGVAPPVEEITESVKIEAETEVEPESETEAAAESQAVADADTEPQAGDDAVEEDTAGGATDQPEA